jgi:hypothetical protein
MFSSADMKMLIGSIVMLICGIGFIVVAILMYCGNATAWKWFGMSVKFHARTGIFATIAGLLNLVRFIVPPTFADTYATFSLASIILLVVGLIVSEFRDRRVR